MYFEKEEHLDAYVGEYICHFIRNHSQPVIGFATGSTPLGVYRYFIDNYQAQKVSFRQVKAFNLDEYVGLDGSDDQSYRYFMNDHLFNKNHLKKHSCQMEKQKTWKLNANVTMK